MASSNLFTSAILGLTLVISTIPSSSHAGEVKNCKAELRGCVGAKGACVWLGIPKESTCDKACQIGIMRRIQNKFPVGVISIPSPKEPRGCVGFRSDLNGTEKGAMCLAEQLGYRFDPIGCNVAGWPYNVVTN